MTTYASPTLASNYQGLCTAIADTLNRQDLTTGIPNFVALATARIQRDIARSRHPAGITRVTLSVTGQATNLPADFIAVYQLRETDQAKFLAYLSPEQFKDVLSQGWPGSVNIYPSTPPYTATVSSGGPDYYTLIGNQLWVMPTYSASVPLSLDLSYYAQLPAINVTTTTNWVLTKYPDLYLYGALVHSAPYLKADERIQLWEGAYQKILADIELEADRATRSQTKLNAARVSF